MRIQEEIKRLKGVLVRMTKPHRYLTGEQYDDKKMLQYKIEALEAELSKEVHSLAVTLVNAFDKSGRMVIMVGSKQRDDGVLGTWASGCKNAEEINRGRVWSRAEELARVSIAHQ